MITAKRARELFNYDRESGVVTRRIAVGSTGPIGKVVGSLTIEKSGRKYIRTGIHGKYYMVHRIIWLMKTGEWPDSIDHINGDATDNSWQNLRSVSHIENKRNSPLPKNNTTGIIGVGFYHNLWRATIGVSGSVVQLYAGHDFFEACCKRRSAEARNGFHKNHGMRRQNNA